MGVSYCRPTRTSTGGRPPYQSDDVPLKRGGSGPHRLRRHAIRGEPDGDGAGVAVVPQHIVTASVGIEVSDTRDLPVERRGAGPDRLRRPTIRGEPGRDGAGI